MPLDCRHDRDKGHAEEVMVLCEQDQEHGETAGPGQYQPVETPYRSESHWAAVPNTRNVGTRWQALRQRCRAGEQCQSATSATAAAMRSETTVTHPASTIRATPTSSQSPTYPQTNQASVT